MCSCGYMFPPMELTDAEATRSIIFYILALYRDRDFNTRVGLAAMIVIFDDMCHLLRCDSSQRLRVARWWGCVRVCV